MNAENGRRRTASEIVREAALLLATDPHAGALSGRLCELLELAVTGTLPAVMLEPLRRSA